MKKRTFAMIKPDAVACHYTGQIITLIEKAGFRIIAQKMLRLNTKVFNCDYSVTATGPFQTVGEYTTTVKGQTKLDIIVIPYSRIEASAEANGEVVTLSYKVRKVEECTSLGYSLLGGISLPKSLPIRFCHGYR